jgi:chemotaxis protein CheC
MVDAYLNSPDGQKDAIRELGSIGAAHAATALSQLLGRRVDISAPTATVLKLEEARGLLETDDIQTYLHSDLLGDASGTILVLFPQQAGFIMADLLMGREPGSTSELDEMSTSALVELANILSGAYLTAISNLLDLVLLASVPKLHYDLTEASSGWPLTELENGTRCAFVVHTEFREAQMAIRGHFLLVPDESTLRAMLVAINRLTGGGSS